jgi:hypothetical protein
MARSGVLGSWVASCALLVGCAAPAAAIDEDHADLDSTELAAALGGHAVDGRGLLGTFDRQGAEPGVARFVFLPDGTALACADPRACRPFDAGGARHPYDVLQTASGGRYLRLRTSASDPTPVGVYGMTTSGDAKSLMLDLHELTGAGRRWQMRRDPCSETMYDERDADHACAYYQCKLDMAPAPADRCGYFEDFGLPYCKKYFETPFEDRAFGPNVRQCLQEAIRDTMEGLSCVDVQEAAIRSHVKCYVASGFCSLSLGDRLLIGGAIAPQNLSFDIVATLAKIEKACLGFGPSDD